MTTEVLLEKLNAEKKADWNFQSRRHSQWNENYELYRDFVETNRLTQRQAVNFPIMKTSLRTLLANVDDAPSILFKILEEGEVAQKKERVMNEIWTDQFEELDFESLDILDKKNVFLYGRSFKLLNFLKEKFSTDVLDPWDIVVDPKTNPMDIQTAKHFERLHIFKSLREVLADEKYTAAGKEQLKSFLDDDMNNSGKGGLLKMTADKESLEARQERLKTMGVDNFDEFAAGDVIVELNEHYTHIWNETRKEFVKHIIVTAVAAIGEAKAILFNKPLKEVIGIDKWSITTWADDMELSDFWSDGRADTVRTPNKILNIWLSQLLENRTLRNYGMHWWDSTKTGYIPTQYEPKPFGMYPCPGDPNKLIKQVNIPDLSESLDEMMFIKQLIEESTAATPTKKGIEGKKKTLGEAEMLLSESDENISGIAKFYNKSWKQYAKLWYDIHDSNVMESKTYSLFKESTKGTGKMFKKIIKAKDWKSEAGYRVKVLSTTEQQRKDIDSVNKWIGIKNQFPDDPKIYKMAKRKILESAGVEKDEIDDAVSAEAEAGPPLPAPAPAMA